MRSEQLTRSPSFPWIQENWARLSTPPWVGIWSWWLRVSAFCASATVVVGVLAQGLVERWGIPSVPPTHPTWTYRLASILVSSIPLALTVGLVSGWLGSLSKHRAGRALAVLVPTLAMTVWFFFFQLSVVTRILSGTYVTWGAVQFLVGSPSHFFHAAVDGYLSWTIGLGVSTALFSLLVNRGLKARMVAPSAGSFTVLFVALLTFVLRPGLVGQEIARSDDHSAAVTPTQALVSSVMREMSNERRVVAGAADLHPTDGPPMVASKLWNLAIAGHESPKPNILLIMLESVSASHIGYEGYRRPVTPNLDKLARDGVRVHRAWTTATHSNYAQMAILSSLFPRRHTQLDMYWQLDYPRELLHDLFHGLGYATASITSQDETWQGMMRFQKTSTPHHLFWNALTYPGKHLDIGTERTVPDSVTAAQAIRWLEEHEGSPWSLYVNFQSTHFPYAIPEDAPRPFKPYDTGSETFNYLWYPKSLTPTVINRYDNALSFVDRQIGKLTTYLTETGQMDDTIIVVTADHGEMFYEHGLVTHGRTLYDAESRIPLLLHWPKKLKSQDVWRPTSHLDILPTITKLLNLPPHPSYQGESLLTPKPRRTGVFMNIQGLKFAEALVCYPWKYIYDETSRTSMLFDLSKDPGEKHDLSSEAPHVAGSMAATLQAQIRAQLVYHEDDDQKRHTHFQPRLLNCPDQTAGELPARTSTARHQP